MASEGCSINARTVLWYLIFIGTAVNYMIRTNINIAIVDMVMRRPSNPLSNATNIVSECFNHDDVSGSESASNSSSSSPNKIDDGHTRYDWDEYQQGMILGGFFSCYWSSQVLGGVLAQKFGTKKVFGLCTLAICLLSILIPVAATIDYRAVVVIRCMQGYFGGHALPSLHCMTANWIPPNERSKFVTAYVGSSVGAALTYPVCGLLIAWFGWPAAFYSTGGLGIVWFVAWMFLTYDTPAKHPRISEDEREYIATSLGKTIVKRKPPIPWGKILTSKAFMMCVIAHWSINCGQFTLLTHAPIFFKYIYGWDVKKAGVLSGVPHACRMMFAFLISAICDYMLVKEVTSRTNVRKFANFVSCACQGIMMLALAFCGCNAIAAVICIAAATGFSGGQSSGPLATYVDLSPNYASVTYGISNMVSATPGFLAPIIVSTLTYQNQTFGQWQKVWLLIAIILMIAGVLALFLTDATLQPWNTPETEGAELKNLDNQYDEKGNPINDVNVIVKERKASLIVD
ncbi:sialin-like [Schistocerca gregaria]|uniref:sialin-like n=1 Tax=Schistocerca gregaria TaxID=7010 RepID=UPI00211E18CD|nr:sialin-like [Schistocerca gregaria]